MTKATSSLSFKLHLHYSGQGTEERQFLQRLESQHHLPTQGCNQGSGLLVNHEQSQDSVPEPLDHSLHQQKPRWHGEGEDTGVFPYKMILESRWLSDNESAAKRLHRDGTVRTLLAALLSVTSWPSVCCLLYLGLPASCCPPHLPATLLALSVQSQMDVRGGISEFIYQMLNGPVRSNDLLGIAWLSRRELALKPGSSAPKANPWGGMSFEGLALMQWERGWPKGGRQGPMLCYAWVKFNVWVNGWEFLNCKTEFFSFPSRDSMKCTTSLGGQERSCYVDCELFHDWTREGERADLVSLSHGGLFILRKGLM